MLAALYQLAVPVAVSLGVAPCCAERWVAEQLEQCWQLGGASALGAAFCQLGGQQLAEAARRLASAGRFMSSGRDDHAGSDDDLR